MIPDDRSCEHFYKRTREFLMTIRNPKTKIFLLSGDVHHAEFTEDKCSSYIHGYPIREFTSSGLTHGLGETGKFGRLLAEVVSFISPKTYNFTPPSAIDTSRYYMNNFGIVDFNFGKKKEDNWVEWSIRNTKGEAVLTHRFKAEDFSGRSKKPDFIAYNDCVAKRGKVWHRRANDMIEKTIKFENFTFYILFILFWVSVSSFCCFISCIKAIRVRVKKEIDEAFCVRRDGGGRSGRGRDTVPLDKDRYARGQKPKVE